MLSNRLFVEIAIAGLFLQMNLGTHQLTETIAICAVALAIVAYHAINAYLACYSETVATYDEPTTPVTFKVDDEAVSKRLEDLEKEISDMKSRTALKEGFKL